jgi:hypothetical protein
VKSTSTKVKKHGLTDFYISIYTLLLAFTFHFFVYLLYFDCFSRLQKVPQKKKNRFRCVPRTRAASTKNSCAEPGGNTANPDVLCPPPSPFSL